MIPFADLSAPRGKLQIFLHHLSAPSVTVWKRHLTPPISPLMAHTKEPTGHKRRAGFGLVAWTFLLDVSLTDTKEKFYWCFFFSYGVIDHCVKHPG